MNRAFKSVWNRATRTWVAAPENARSKTKGSRRAMSALTVGYTLFGVTQAIAAPCDHVTYVCSNSATLTVSTPNSTYNGNDYTFKGYTTVYLYSGGQLAHRDHRFENGDGTSSNVGAQLKITSSNAIAASQTLRFFGNSALNFETLSAEPFPFSATAAAISAGTFYFDDTASLNATHSGAIGGGTFNLAGNSRAYASQNTAINAASLNLSGTAELESNQMYAIKNTTFTLSGTSKVFIKANDAITDSDFTLNGDSTLEAEKTLKAKQVVLNDSSTLYLHGTDGNYTIESLTGSGGNIVNADNASTAGLSLLGDGSDTSYVWSGTFNANAHGMDVYFKRGIWQFTGGSDDNTLLILEDKAQFTGYGTYGSMSALAGSSIAPGFNTLSLNNLGFEDGARYVVSARDDGTASKLVVRDLLELQTPLTIHVEAQAGAWNTAQSYDIITWGSKTGANFTNSNVTANFAYLTPTVTEHSNKLELQLVRNSSGNPGSPVSFASQAQSTNQLAVANAVEALPSAHTVHNYVLTLPVGAPAATFDNLSGEAHSSLTHTTLTLTDYAPRASLANLRNSLNAGLNPAAASAQVGGTMGSTGLPAFGDKPAWVSVLGNWQKFDGDSNSAQLDQNSAGVFVGYDNEINNGWYLGGALGYTQTDADVSTRHSDAELNSYSATVYGGKAFALDTQRQLNLSVGLSYSYHDIETKRRILGLEQKLRANYDAHSTQVFSEVGYLIGQPDARNIEPFVGLTVTHISSDSFKEKGGSAALRSRSESETQTVSTLGVRGQTPYELGNFGATVYGSLGWQHAFNRTQFDRTMAFVDGGQAFSVEGVALDRDTAIVGLGTKVNLTPRTAVSLDYQGRFASGLRDHSAALQAQWSF